MLGLAVGDSLGNTSEGHLPEERSRTFGTIRDYLPNHRVQGAATTATGRPKGYPTDDTQLAFWTLEQMLEDGRMDPANVATRFSRGSIFGIGSSVKEFLRNTHAGLPWYQCGPESAGNGALMRIAPVLIPHVARPSADLWVDAALCAMITHNDTASISACVAFVSILWELLAMSTAPTPDWWARQYISAARDLETGKAYPPRGGPFRSYSGPLWQFVEERLVEARKQRLSTLQACNSWYSGAFLAETVPSVLYILECHGQDPEEAILRAVNETKDNDTVAAIVGAAAGALHGKRNLPSRWIEALSGRTTEKDDGKIFEILKLAREAWAGPLQA